MDNSQTISDSNPNTVSTSNTPTTPVTLEYIIDELVSLKNDIEYIRNTLEVNNNSDATNIKPEAGEIILHVLADNGSFNESHINLLGNSPESVNFSS